MWIDRERWTKLLSEFEDDLKEVSTGLTGLIVLSYSTVLVVVRANLEHDEYAIETIPKLQGRGGEITCKRTETLRVHKPKWRRLGVPARLWRRGRTAALARDSG